MRRLHRLVDHLYQVLGHAVKIHIVAQLGVECLQGLGYIVLPAVEAAVYERLYSPAQGTLRPLTARRLGPPVALAYGLVQGGERVRNPRSLVYGADPQLATNAGVAVRHGDGTLLVARGMVRDATVSRHVIYQTEVSAADQPEGRIDPEPIQGLGDRFVHLHPLPSLSYQVVLAGQL
jgi:hypothetical protein